jgi:hypothetical protein
VVVVVVVGLFEDVTQAAGDEADVVESNVAVLLDLVEIAVLAVAVVNVIVLHAQESPTAEMRRAGWMGQKSFHQDIDRTGKTWWLQATCSDSDRVEVIYRAGSRRVILCRFRGTMAMRHRDPGNRCGLSGSNRRCTASVGTSYTGTYCSYI